MGYTSYYFYGLGVSWISIFIIVGLYLLFTGKYPAGSLIRYTTMYQLSLPFVVFMIGSGRYRTRRDLQHR